MLGKATLPTDLAQGPGAAPHLVFQRGEAEPHMTLALRAEGLPRSDRHAAFVEQAIGERP
jgi:hypothetical protein